jgi:hypothetical protein
MSFYRFFLKSPFWMLFPALIIVGQIGLEIFVPDEYMPELHSEYGPHEILQGLVLFPAIFLALRVIQLAPTGLLKAWGGLALIGSVYVFGEELSWGQHLFDWTTPEFWTQINDQGETNLHNTSSWLDQKPRLALEIGVIVCGILLPLLLKFAPRFVPARLAPILGDREVIPSALLFAFLKVIDKTYSALDLQPLFWRSSEVEELYIFLFVVIYLSILCRRFEATRGTAA